MKTPSRSSPARGTWIEIQRQVWTPARQAVVPRKGDVDRNVNEEPSVSRLQVVPRKGDVDRNILKTAWKSQSRLSSPARGGRG